jgi:hypothetical protein
LFRQAKASTETDPALGKDTGDDLDGGAFSGDIRPRQADDLTSARRERDPVQGFRLVVRKSNAFEFDHCLLPPPPQCR